MKVSLPLKKVAGIYLHIPFCKQACHYCDFHFSTNRSSQHELVNAIVAELYLQKNYLQGDPIGTIYFGGGTPSLLSLEELEIILSTIKKIHNLIPAPEITLEANPDDLNDHTLRSLHEAGVNRLSIGIQSFHDHILKFMNRVHSSSTATESVIAARRAGFDNISIDLIYAIPGQTENEWLDDIRQAIALNPEHISAYSLTIEEKTVFGRQTSTGSLKPVDDDTAAHHLEVLMNELDRAGYEHYEVSNFCRPGFQSRHNSSYWKQEMYLGIGPSAHSYNGVSRQLNINNNAVYTRSISAGNVPFQIEELTREDHINEYLLTTLRTNWGSDVEKLKKQFDHDILALHRGYLDDLFLNDLAILEKNHLKLTRKGKLFADKIASDLFVLAT